MDKNPCSNAVNMGLIPRQRTKVPQATGQPHQMLQKERSLEKACVPQRRPSAAKIKTVITKNK